MSLLGTIFASSVSDLQSPQPWLVDWVSGRKTQAGERVSPNGALALSAYYACARVVAEDVAKLPLLTYRRLRPRGKERVDDHPSFELLHERPNEDMTAFVVRASVTFAALSWGNGYAEIQRNGFGRPVALWPLVPWRVRPLADLRRSPRGSVVYEITREDGTRTRLSPSEVLHVHGLGFDGYLGYSVAQVGAESLGLSIAAQTFGASFFGQGASPSGVLSHPGHLRPEALANLRQSWGEMYVGPYNAGRPAILEEGMKWEKLGIPPEEAQFIETRQFQIEEICRWFRVPPHKIQHLLRATFSNIEQQSIEYVSDALMPWLVRWEQEVRRKLFAPDERDLFAEHLVMGLLRGDQAARSAYYRERFFIGTMSQNDIREKENENPIGPEGDVYYVPANLVRSEDAARGRTTGERPPGPQGPEPEEMRGALRALLVDAASRWLRKELRATERARRRRPEELKRWAERFFTEQERYAAECFAPALEVARCLQRLELEVRCVAGQLAARRREAFSHGEALDLDREVGEIVAMILGALAPQPMTVAINGAEIANTYLQGGDR